MRQWCFLKQSYLPRENLRRPQIWSFQWWFKIRISGIKSCNVSNVIINGTFSRILTINLLVSYNKDLALTLLGVHYVLDALVVERSLQIKLLSDVLFVYVPLEKSEEILYYDDEIIKTYIFRKEVGISLFWCANHRLVVFGNSIVMDIFQANDLATPYDRYSYYLRLVNASLLSNGVTIRWHICKDNLLNVLFCTTLLTFVVLFKNLQLSV